ncbi:CopD family protein [Rhizobium sp.]|uniref:CopD family protein n=1 Tax=Rhizobium sp. TaxID=391 RepID=UPI0028AC712E
MTPHDALVLDRFLLDTALCVVWGGGGFAHITTNPMRRHLQACMATPLLSAAGIAALASVATVPIQTAEIGSSWQSAVQVNVVLDVIFRTDVGVSTCVEVVTVLAMLVAASLKHTAAAVIIAGVALFEIATRGHAASSFDLSGIARITVMGVHILAAAGWVGALLPFIMLVHLSGQPALRRNAVSSMIRFSTLGHITVALVLITGVANIAVILGRVPGYGSSFYQAALLTKIFAVAAMTCIAIANRYIFVAIGRDRPGTSRQLLMAGTTLEIALGLLAFALVASFGLDDPTT